MAVIVCPTCATKYRVADSQLSQASRLRCKKCNTVFKLKDHLATDQASQWEKRGPQIPASQESSKTTQQALADDLLNFDFAQPRSSQPLASQGSDTPESQKDVTQDMNLGDMTLDFGTSAESSGVELDFSFSAAIPEGQELAEAGEAYEDTESAFQGDQKQPGAETLDFSFSDSDAGVTEPRSLMGDTLDFSFTAHIPEVERDIEQEEVEGIAGEGIATGAQEEVTLEQMDDGGGAEATVTLPPGYFPKPSLSRQEELPSVQEEPVEKAIEQESIPEPEEPLATCCIDSLAMGLKRCDICGRNLEGQDIAFVEELREKRKQELKEALLQGAIQVGFSEEQGENRRTPVDSTVSEDFTDVERALDALADGSFEKELRKQEAKKARAQKLRMVGVAIGLVIVLAAGGLWMLRPSAHDKLVSRYQDLVSHQEPDPRELVTLFLDASIGKDMDVFKRLSVMQTMPDITGGEVISVGDEYDKISLGLLGKNSKVLKDEIATLEKESAAKTKELQQYAAMDLSPGIIEETINSLTKKLTALETEFEEKKAESGEKLASLRQELADTEREIEENQSTLRKYVDATDKIGKALYKNSLAKQQPLADQKSKIEAQIHPEAIEHNQRVQVLKAEYQPQLDALRAKLETQQALLKQANLLQDQEKSPVTLLSRDLERLSATLKEKKSALEEMENQLKFAMMFFTQNNQKALLTKNLDAIEFAHVRRNVIAAMKYRGYSKQQLPIVLKRYQAIIGDQTVKSDWLVEKIGGV